MVMTPFPGRKWLPLILYSLFINLCYFSLVFVCAGTILTQNSLRTLIIAAAVPRSDNFLTTSLMDKARTLTELYRIQEADRTALIERELAEEHPSAPVPDALRRYRSKSFSNADITTIEERIIQTPMLLKPSVGAPGSEPSPEITPSGPSPKPSGSSAPAVPKSEPSHLSFPPPNDEINE